MKNRTQFLNNKLEEISQYQNQITKVNEELLIKDKELETTRNQLLLSTKTAEGNDTKSELVEKLHKELTNAKEKTHKLQNDIDKK